MKFFSNQTFLGSSGMGGSPPATPPRRAIEEAHPLISPVPENPPARPHRTRAEEEQVRIRRRALENCRKALELLENAAGEPYDEDVAKDAPLATARGEEGSPLRSDTDADEMIMHLGTWLLLETCGKTDLSMGRMTENKMVLFSLGKRILWME
ncbi:unnamed protein product [Musa acuminata var. zebrina]